MPIVRFTKENLLERKQLQPGWRVLEVKSIEEGPGKNDPSSIVYACKLTISDGPEAGVPINHWFSEKAQGRIVDFVKCFVPGEVEEGKDYELAQTVGKKVGGYCKYNMSQGFNVIEDWRPATAGKAPGNGGKK